MKKNFICSRKAYVNLHQYCTPLTSLSFVADAWCPDGYHRSPDGDCERVSSVVDGDIKNSEPNDGDDGIVKQGKLQNDDNDDNDDNDNDSAPFSCGSTQNVQVSEYRGSADVL